MPGNKGFRYTYAPAQITKLLEKVQITLRPDTLNFSYIRDTWLFKNAQYSAVLDLLEDMEFIDNSGRPTELYAEYQNKALAKKALAKGIRKAYPQLFKAFPSPQTLPKSELEGYFRQQTGKVGSVLEKMVSTFITLCSLADFSVMESVQEQQLTEYGGQEAAREKPRVKLEPSLYVNIEIHISPEMTDEKIEAIFKNMKRYLLSNE